MGLFEILIALLVLGWLGGFSLHIAGGLIHLLLVIALILFVVRMLRGRSV